MPSVDTAQSFCSFGFARGDITPPVGMYHRNWGAATHDVATGVHRPLMALALAFGAAPEVDRSPEGVTRKIVLVLDHCVLWGRAMEEFLRQVECAAELPPAQLEITFSHTHAAGLLDASRTNVPGGHLVRPYLDRLVNLVANLVRSALDAMQPASIVYGTGHCDLAAQRDFWDERSGRYVCGFNPEGLADETVVVARVSDSSDRVLATVVNYACHPTTLGWQNTLISPDFPGVTRDVIETATGAPCVFLQGASGDLGPREGFVGDVAAVERNGRQLAYAALSALESLPRGGTRFEYAGPVTSGAMLGTWRHARLDEASQRRLRRWRSWQLHVRLPVRPDLTSRECLQEKLATCQKQEQGAQAAGDAAGAQTARALVERWRRELSRIQLVPEQGDYPLGVSLWQIGDAFWVSVAGEEYQYFQTTLRRRFPRTPIVVMTLTNSSLPTYLPTTETYGKGIYQESIALLAPGTLETLVEEVGRQLQEWHREYLDPVSE